MYYLVIIQNESVPAIFGYETYDAALSAYHNELAYRGTGRTSTTCMIINSKGSMYVHETWVAQE